MARFGRCTKHSTAAALLRLLAFTTGLASVCLRYSALVLLLPPRRPPHGGSRIQRFANPSSEPFEELNDDQLTAQLRGLGLPTDGSRIERTKRLQVDAVGRIREGDNVIVKTGFTSMSKSMDEINKGTKGVVSYIDDDGDALVDFVIEGKSKQLWVAQERFGFLSVMSEDAETQTAQLSGAGDGGDDDSVLGLPLLEQRPPDEVLADRRSAILSFDLKPYGVGGLSNESRSVLQRSLLSRSLDPEMRKRLGMKRERGLLLFGQPGCGKTLIARALGRILCAASVQYITAAEINSKWFGENDQRMKALFSPARKSESEGRAHDLHLVVMDEIDALTATRGSDVSRPHESALNVLLSCLDGFEENEQTFVIGLTNRRDKLDPALLRPGRLGVHVEVKAPDAAGRLEILQIHAGELLRNDYLSPEVSLNEISLRMDGSSGADLSQLVNTATSIALLDAKDYLATGAGNLPTHFVDQSAFDAAMKELGS